MPRVTCCHVLCVQNAMGMCHLPRVSISCQLGLLKAYILHSKRNCAGEVVLSDSMFRVLLELPGECRRFNSCTSPQLMLTDKQTVCQIQAALAKKKGFAALWEDTRRCCFADTACGDTHSSALRCELIMKLRLQVCTLCCMETGKLVLLTL